MTNDPLVKLYDDVKALLREMDGIRDAIADLKLVNTKGPNAMTPEAWSDLVAVARLAVMDDAKRAKRETAERRRKELSEQLELAIP